MPFDLTKAKLERAGIKDIVVLTAKGTYLGKAAYSNEIPGEVQETNKDNKKYFRSAVIGKKYLLPPDVIEKLKHLPASQGWYCITQELLLIDKYRRGEWRGLFSLHSIEELAEIINQCPHFFAGRHPHYWPFWQYEFSGPGYQRPHRYKVDKKTITSFPRFMPFDLIKAKLECAGIFIVKLITAEGTHTGPAEPEKEIPGTDVTPRHFKSAIINRTYRIAEDEDIASWYCVAQELHIGRTRYSDSWRGLFIKYKPFGALSASREVPDWALQNVLATPPFFPTD